MGSQFQREWQERQFISQCYSSDHHSFILCKNFQQLRLKNICKYAEKSFHSHQPWCITKTKFKYKRHYLDSSEMKDELIDVLA